MAVKIEVDAALCSGHGRCYVLSAELFQADDEGYSAQRGVPFTVGDELLESAELAAESCPEGAIRVTQIGSTDLPVELRQTGAPGYLGKSRHRDDSPAQRCP